MVSTGRVDSASTYLPARKNFSTAEWKQSRLVRFGDYSEGCSTRSHLEHDRETPQRQWYYDLSHGRVGRRQTLQAGFCFYSESDYSFPTAVLPNGGVVVSGPS